MIELYYKLYDVLRKFYQKIIKNTSFHYNFVIMSKQLCYAMYLNKNNTVNMMGIQKR